MLKAFLFTILRIHTDRNPEDSSLSDHILVSKVLESKDSQFFGILYDRYSQKVYSKCFGFVKNADEAKDLTQDIFLKVFLKLKTFDQAKSSFSTWLYVITSNHCSNYVTRDPKYKYRTDPWDDTLERLAEKEDVSIDVINALDTLKLGKALDRIPVDDKAILLLKYRDDIPIKELQNILGIKESAVKMRLKRARIRVIEMYQSLENQ